MPGELLHGTNKPYLRIVDGHLVQAVEEGTPGAKLRKWELPTGQKGEKWELNYSSWSGKITGVNFRETEYGEVCILELEDAALSINTVSRYFSDMASKLYGADLTQDITLHPYDFESEGKRFKGVSVQQDGAKLKNYFYDGEKNLHGFPEVDKSKTSKKTYWKIYFAEVAEFLVEQLKALKFPEIVNADTVAEVFDDGKGELPWENEEKNKPTLDPKPY